MRACQRDTDLARGRQAILAAASAVMRTVAAAPSERVLAFPAVTVPPSFWNTVTQEMGSDSIS
jgi:hypothetical protein